MKTCSKCKTVKELSMFYRRADGYKSSCKTCCDEYGKRNVHRHKEYARAYHRSAAGKARTQAWRDRNPGYHRHQARKSKYGITGEQFNEMMAAQGGACDMCKRPETLIVNGRVRDLCVDHCHETGQIRGLLCMVCNVCAKPDDIQHLELRIAYLKRHQPRPSLVDSFTQQWMRN